MEQIVFLDRAVFGDAPLRPPNFPHTWTNYTFSHTETEATVAERVKDATIILTNRTPLPAGVIRACAKLRLVAVAATGYDLVDVRACTAQGVVVCNVRDWAISIPEHIFSLALALRRQLLQYRAAIRDGAWARTTGTSFVLAPLPQALAGSSMGLVGYGALAKRVEKIALAFGMDVVLAERRGAGRVREGRVAFDEALQKSDVLVVLCPLSDETRGLIGERELGMMKADAVLVNCARGGIVDEGALARALQEGRIGGAGVDVLQEEPPVNGSPLLELDLPNLIVTSHVAWASTASARMMAEQLMGNLEAFVRGEPRNVVTA